MYIYSITCRLKRHYSDALVVAPNLAAAKRMHPADGRDIINGHPLAWLGTDNHDDVAALRICVANDQTQRVIRSYHDNKLQHDI